MAKEILEKFKERYKNVLTKENMHRALSMVFLKPKKVIEF